MGHGLRITAGTFKGRVLKTGDGPGYRPATALVREALFSMLEARGHVWTETLVLDLFAGSGSLGFEALSRGARGVWFVEQDKKAAQLIRDNAAQLGIEPHRVTVLCKDIFAVLPRREGFQPPLFPLVFVDPPYGKGYLMRSLKQLLQFGWATPGGTVVAEVEAGLDLDPEAPLPGLALQADRRYGQTRILLWNTPATILPSTPEPSTP